MSVEVLVPEMGESVLEATVTEWYKKEGEPVQLGEALLSLETNKVNLEVAAQNAGVLAEIKVQRGEDVKVGDVLALIDEKVMQPKETLIGASPQPTQGSTQPDGRGMEHRSAPAITPVAARIVKEEGIDIHALTGTGPEGRVTRSDVEQYLREAEEQERPTQQATPPPAIQVEPIFEEPSTPRREEHVRMSRRRRTIAQRLLEAKQTTAMLTTFNEVDMSAVMGLRKRRNEDFQARFGVKLGIASFFVKAAIGALKTFPRLNAEIDGDQIVLKHYYDIGIAIGAEDGLVVPVIREADRLSFAEIEHQIRDFAERTNTGKLSIEDLRGGTFTITNGGVFGSMLSTPILNPPQVGILGLHKIGDRPVALNGEVVIRPMMYMALSYDHRIVDGREAVQFLVKVRELIEDPEKLLLEG